MGSAISSLLFAGALICSVPFALADDLVIAPEAGVQFHTDVKTKKLRSVKHEGDLKVGVVLPAEVEYYDVPADVVVATPTLKTYEYVYLNDRIYVVEPGERRIVAVVD